MFLFSVLAFIVASALFFSSCASRPIESGGPFYRAELVANGLMTEIVQETIKLRMVYPPIALDIKYRKMIDEFLKSKINEYTIFHDVMKQKEYISELSRIPNQSFHLMIYSYTITDRVGIASIVFEVQYKSSSDPVTRNWYTLNIDKDELRVIEDEALFENPIAANSVLVTYALKDIVRQRTERGLTSPSLDFDSLEDSNIEQMFLSFVFLPSTRKSSKFAGIRVYISQFAPTNEAVDVESIAFAVNVPYAIIRPFLRSATHPYFRRENVPFITRKLETQRAFVYPDLSPLLTNK